MDQFQDPIPIKGRNYGEEPIEFVTHYASYVDAMIPDKLAALSDLQEILYKKRSVKDSDVTIPYSDYMPTIQTAFNNTYNKYLKQVGGDNGPSYPQTLLFSPNNMEIGHTTRGFGNDVYSEMALYSKIPPVGDGRNFQWHGSAGVFDGSKASVKYKSGSKSVWTYNYLAFFFGRRGVGANLGRKYWGTGIHSDYIHTWDIAFRNGDFVYGSNNLLRDLTPSKSAYTPRNRVDMAYEGLTIPATSVPFYIVQKKVEDEKPSVPVIEVMPYSFLDVEETNYTSMSMVLRVVAMTGASEHFYEFNPELGVMRAIQYQYKVGQYVVLGGDYSNTGLAIGKNVGCSSNISGYQDAIFSRPEISGRIVGLYEADGDVYMNIALARARWFTPKILAVGETVFGQGFYPYRNGPYRDIAYNMFASYNKESPAEVNMVGYAIGTSSTYYQYLQGRHGTPAEIQYAASQKTIEELRSDSEEKEPEIKKFGGMPTGGSGGGTTTQAQAIQFAIMAGWTGRYQRTSDAAKLLAAKEAMLDGDKSWYQSSRAAIWRNLRIDSFAKAYGEDGNTEEGWDVTPYETGGPIRRYTGYRYIMLAGAKNNTGNSSLTTSINMSEVYKTQGVEDVRVKTNKILKGSDGKLSWESKNIDIYSYYYKHIVAFLYSPMIGGFLGGKSFGQRDAMSLTRGRATLDPVYPDGVLAAVGVRVSMYTVNDLKAINARFGV